MRLKLNQELQLETNDGNQVHQYKALVKEIKSPRITVYLPEQKTREMFPLGSFQALLVPGAQKIKVKIEGNENIPYVNLRILEENSAKKEEGPPLETLDLKTLLQEVHREEFRGVRSALRVADSSPIEFYLQTPKGSSQKKETYARASSGERKRRFLLERGVLSPEVFLKIDQMGDDFFDVFSDIYRKIATMSGIDLGLEEEEERKENAGPENIGTCVDISGSGLRFLCGTRFRPGDILKVIISPLAARPRFSISALVKVIRVIRVKDGSASQCYATVTKYYAIHEDDMETLTRYTVLRQIEERARQKQGRQAPGEGSAG